MAAPVDRKRFDGPSSIGLPPPKHPRSQESGAPAGAVTHVAVPVIAATNLSQASRPSIFDTLIAVNRPVVVSQSPEAFSNPPPELQKALWTSVYLNTDPLLRVNPQMTIDLFSTALRWMNPPIEDRPALVFRLAEACAQSGNLDQAITLLTQEFPVLPSSELRVSFRYQLALYHRKRDRPGDLEQTVHYCNLNTDGERKKLQAQFDNCPSRLLMLETTEELRRRGAQAQGPMGDAT